MEARAVRDVFWDDDFGWETAPSQPDDAVAEPVDVATAPIPAAPAAAALTRPAPAPARLAARRRRAARGIAAAAAVLASVGAAVALSLTGGDDPAPTKRPGERAASTVRALTPAPDVAADVARIEQAAERRPLAVGDRGPAVRALQRTLVAIGLEPGRADGVLRERTRAAVVAFQRDAGLVADGVVGPETATALARAAGRGAAAAAVSLREGLAAAVRDDRLPAAAAARHRRTLERAVTALARLPAARAGILAAALETAAANAGELDQPVARIVFGAIATNVDRLGARPAPHAKETVTGAGGVAYRFFPAHGFQFHPLANFSAMNVHVTRDRQAAARRLGHALLARASADGDALVWEYAFPFGGPARWTSGFAQAVAADAFARAGELLGDEELTRAAAGAFRAIPAGLRLAVDGGAWIREYSFSETAVLNAQLQTMLSLRDYVRITGDAEARALTERLRETSLRLLPRFDTGCWSLYSLRGEHASVPYHRYHVSLLKQLGRATRDARWTNVAARWQQSLAGAPEPQTAAAAACAG
jgi:peptidoglycan hydrolase-like protein with peptidoglycan-binding domain